MTAAAGNFLLPAERAVSLRSAGYDFLAFYTAGTFLRTAQADQLYDVEAVCVFQQNLARRHGLELSERAVGPFWNPPFYWRGRIDELARDRIISVMILATPLLMPFYFDYDLLLLAVPAALAAREAIARGYDERGVTLAWAALYAWLVVKPHVAALTHANGTVVLIAIVTGATMRNAIGRRTSRARAMTAVPHTFDEAAARPRAAA